VISITDKDPRLAGETSSPAAKEVRLTVTGLDEKGQMFRESAPILELDGRDCHFRSKFQPELGSWVLVEFDSSKAGSKRTTLQGQVKSAQPEALAGNFHRIQVELESAQDLKIAPTPQPVKMAAPALKPPPAAPAPKAAASPAPKEAPPETLTRTKPEIKAAISLPLEVPPSKAAAPVSRELPAPKQQADATGLGREADAATVALEVKQQLTALKDSFREELERIAQRTISSGMEPLIRQAVEKQIAANYQSAIQTLNSDLTYQLAGRLASSEELRNSIENLAKKAVEEQRNSNGNIAEITQNFEKSIAQIENKMKVTEGAATATLERTQALEREVAESTQRLQEVADQLNQAVRTTIEKFDGHVTSQLNSWSAQFKNHVDGISREKAAQFTSGLQQQLSTQVQEANEVLEKLSAGLQLARGTVRAQESQLAERSRELTAEFEKEIKSILIRLAGSV
jgi:uncharacterized phage infection (PIP) family protein YhgE